MPMDWDEAIHIHSKDSLLKYGYVPYWITEMQVRLTNAFRQQKGDSILFYAIDLGHYIGDAHVPLHTSLNYDGQLTGQRGLHSLWESLAAEQLFDQLDLRGQKKARYLRSPQLAIWEAVRHAHSLLPEVFETERELTKAFTEATKYRTEQRNGREYRYYTKEFGLAYGKRLQGSINDQLRRSANLMADFWYTAWVDGGRPNLAGLLPGAVATSHRKKIRNELKAYRKNTLLQKGWLLSRKSAVPAEQ
jgi:hypothetical protein